VTSIEQALATNSNDPYYTEWWVNGPLSNGSPVQILNGWASVTGSEDLSISGIGTRHAWIVTSELNQSASLTVPSTTGIGAPSADTNIVASLDLLWSYDRSNDLLLRTDKNITLTMDSLATETLPSACYPSCGGIPYTTVTVTRDTSVTLNLALLLSSTNINNGEPHSPDRTSSSSLMGMLAGLPWMPLGIAGGAAGAIAGVTVGLTRRNKPTPPPSSVPPSPPPAA
jgi:hypothetical protein